MLVLCLQAFVIPPFAIQKSGFSEKGGGITRGDEERIPASASCGTGGRHPRSVGYFTTPEGRRDPRSHLHLRAQQEGRVDLRRGRLRLDRFHYFPGRPA